LDFIATHIWEGPSKHVDTDKVRLIGFHDLAPDRVESAAIKTLALFPVRALDFRVGSFFPFLTAIKKGPECIQERTFFAEASELQPTTDSFHRR
jgi:hypothetical protein